MSNLYAVRWGTKEQPEFDQTQCRLKYYVGCSGISLDTYGVATDPNKSCMIEVFNSRGEIARGNIKIPHAKIPEVIEALNKFYYEAYKE